VTLRWWHWILAALALAALQLAAVFNPAIIEVDSEEMFNAGQAWQMLDCHLGDAFRLQYRDFCGGCTLDAVLGMGAFSLFGRSWLAWKVVPLVFVVAVAVLGGRAAERIAGRPAALAFLALLLLPPRTWLFLSGIAWGNHYEAGCLVLCGLALLLGAERPRGAVLAGAVLGLATWTGFAGSFGIAAALLWLALTSRRALLPPLLGGIACGLLPWAVQWLSSGLHPFVTVYESSEAAPALSRIPYKLGTLLWPRQLVALFGLPAAGLGWWLGWAWAASLAAAGAWLAVVIRREGRTSPLGRAALAVALFAGLWLAMYCVVRFQVYDPPAPEIAYPTSARYAAPLYPLAFFALALAAGTLWSRGQRALGALLLAGPLLAGTLARAESLQDPFPVASMARLEAADWEFLRPGFGTRLPLPAIEDCSSDDLRTRQLHAYALGREASAQLLRSDTSLEALEPPTHSERPSWWQGVGEAVAKHLDAPEPPSSVSGSPEQHPSGAANSIAVLQGTHSHLERISGATSTDTSAALRAAAALRYGTAIDWLRVQGGWDRAAIPAIAARLRSIEQPVVDAIWWAHGRSCGRMLAKWGRPQPLPLPAGLERVPGDFFEGLGTALGERWGPMGEIPRPGGLPRHAGRALLRGYQRGVASRWLDAQDLRPPELPLP